VTIKSIHINRVLTDSA